MSKRFVLTVVTGPCGWHFRARLRAGSCRGALGEPRDREVVDHHRRLCAGHRRGARARSARARRSAQRPKRLRAILARPGDVRGALILGLVLIESLVIYVLLISFLLFFFKPFGG